MEIKIDKLKSPLDLSEVEKILLSRIDEASSFEINLENIEKINLANFNALIKLYMKVRRVGKNINFIKCNAKSIQSFIEITKFNNVFSTQ